MNVATATRRALIVCTREYFLAHGKQPRGTGTWAFFFDSAPDAWWARDERGVTNLTYSAALKLAKAEARRRGAHVVTVGS